MKKRVLVVIAHPDDETIWMGGVLLENRNDWDTNIISLCRRDDKERAPKFRKACSMFNVKCFMSDLEDDKLEDVRTDEVIKRIKEFSDKNYDYIFSHGLNGEYGHKRHVDVNRAVVQMIKDKSLSAKKLFFFSYAKRGRIYCAKENSDKFIKLNNSQLQLKRKIIQEIYGFNKNCFEYICCRNTEAFEVEEII